MHITSKEKVDFNFIRKSIINSEILSVGNKGQDHWIETYTIIN